MKNVFIGAALTIAAASFASQAFASPMGNSGQGGGQGGGGVTGNDCDTSRISLTSMTTITDLNTNLLVGTPYNANNCIGLYAEPNNIASNYGASPNIGWLGDGLLNGEYYNGMQLVSPTAFIDASQLMNLGSPGNDGAAVDPGWISLGKFEQDDNFAGEYFDILGSQIGNFDLHIGDVLSISFQCGANCSSGTWSLTTSADIIDKVQGALGNRSTFDHLAFAFKAGPEWAVYDFDFNQIFGNEFAQGNSFGDPFNTPFAFFGEWDTGDFNKNISNFAVFARDPITTTTIDVPAPATLAILGLGLLVLRLFRR